MDIKEKIQIIIDYAHIHEAVVFHDVKDINADITVIKDEHLWYKETWNPNHVEQHIDPNVLSEIAIDDIISIINKD